MREYMDQQHALDPKWQDGKAWYEEQAYRAINQSLGRCIRHKNDYGAIILLESRFRNPSTRGKLSKWFRNSITITESEEQLQNSLKEFFERCARDYDNCSLSQGINDIPSSLPIKREAEEPIFPSKSQLIMRTSIHCAICNGILCEGIVSVKSVPFIYLQTLLVQREAMLHFHNLPKRLSSIPEMPILFTVCENATVTDSSHYCMDSEGMLRQWTGESVGGEFHDPSDQTEYQTIYCRCLSACLGSEQGVWVLLPVAVIVKQSLQKYILVKCIRYRDEMNGKLVVLEPCDKTISLTQPSSQPLASSYDDQSGFFLPC